MHRDIIDILNNNSLGFELKSTTTGVSNVYSELNITGRLEDLVKLDDISNFHVVRFDLEVSYQSICNASTINYFVPCTNATVENSDKTYTDSVAGGQTLVLPDITHTDSDGSSVVLPAQTPFVCTPSIPQSGILSRRPLFSFQDVSYADYDEKYQFNQGWFNFNTPANPLVIQDLSLSLDITGRTLLNNNIFGNKIRFTTISGDLPTNINGQYIIDNLTGLGYWDATDFVNTKSTWNDLFGFNGKLKSLNDTNFQGFNDWIVSPISVLNSIQDAINVSGGTSTYMLPHLETQQQTLISSTTQAGTTTSCLAAIHIGGQAAQSKTLNRFFLLTRKHF
jgi:hypothetical protein